MAKNYTSNSIYNNDNKKEITKKKRHKIEITLVVIHFGTRMCLQTEELTKRKKSTKAPDLDVITFTSSGFFAQIIHHRCSLLLHFFKIYTVSVKNKGTPRFSKKIHVSADFPHKNHKIGNQLTEYVE